MLNRLRLNLTLLYVGMALGLVALVSLGAYSLLGFYFQRQTDLALGYKMALTFQQFNIPLPESLKQAEQDWLQGESGGLALAGDSAPTAAIVSGARPAASGEEDSDENEAEDHDGEATEKQAESYHEEEERYNSQLASIYVLPVNASGSVIQSPGTVAPPYALDQAALRSASTAGVDVRTVRLANREPVRILTYRVNSSEGPFFFQVGRSLADQDRVKTQFLLGLALLGAASGALVGVTSWWLAGKSILPAQRSWDQQQTFISNASHELRTPLTLIKASADVLQRSKLKDADQTALVGDILNECDYMDRLVGDLLLLSRLDTRRLLLARRPIDLAGLLAEIEKQAQKLAGEKQIRVWVGPVSGAVWGDDQRLRQVLLILLDNALRFTPPGGEIRLDAGPVGRPAGATCRIQVTDNGAGIPARDLPHIFDRFYQANPTGEGQGRSNGLGLSIARGLVEAMGGTIRLASRPGEGAQAIIELPAAGASPRGASGADPRQRR